MRSATFLSVALLLSAALFAHSFFPKDAPLQGTIAQIPHSRPDMRGSDGQPMVTRAYIEVVPLDLLVERNKQLEYLRGRVTQGELDALKLSSSNRGLREHLFRQIDTMQALLHYIERAESDQGKSPAALEVKRHLNEIEGKVNCGACHTGVVARGATSGRVVLVAQK
jgi:hypothetical protein